MKTKTRLLGLLLMTSAVTTQAANIIIQPGVGMTAERIAVFEEAADQWEAMLNLTVDVVVEAEFAALTCTAGSGTLGYAGPYGWLTQTYTGILTADALTNQLAGFDFDPEPDITAQFNSSVNGSAGCLNGANWYYGLDHNAPVGDIDLLEVVMHELAHGLGFISYVDDVTGELAFGLPHIYEYFLYDLSTGQYWRNMDNAGRLASGINTGNVIWTGSVGIDFAVWTLFSGYTGLWPQMYAPSPYQPGSSISHFDISMQYLPSVGNGGTNELMEPQRTGDFQMQVSIAAFCDMTWDVLRDLDNDGYTDCVDAFPDDAGAAVDFDNDFYADDWLGGSGCSGAECSGVLLDGDDDNDGVQDVVDADPLDAGNTNEIDLSLDSDYSGNQLEHQQGF